MSQPTLEDVFDRIHDLETDEASVRSTDKLINAAVEELGEIAKARDNEERLQADLSSGRIQGAIMPANRESSATEAIDLMICAVALFYRLSERGEGPLTEIAMDKLDKWEARLSVDKETARMIEEKQNAGVA